jgi:hypothetical protein
MKTICLTLILGCICLTIYNWMTETDPCHRNATHPEQCSSDNSPNRV